MNCDEFRQQIFESIGDEPAAERQPEFSQHELSCAVCRAELARWRQIEAALRSGWPAEDPPPLPVLSFRRPHATWWEVGWRWFSAASATLVTASLLALVLLRPSVQWDGARVGVSFRRAALSSTAGPVGEKQIQSWVQAAVKREVAEQSARAGVVSPAPTLAWNDPEAQRWGQVTSRLELLDESQAYLWRQVQEQQMSLVSLWRNTPTQAKPAPPDHPGAE